LFKEVSANQTNYQTPIPRLDDALASKPQRSLFGVGIVGCLILGGVVWILSEFRESHALTTEHSFAGLQRQFARIEVGDQHDIYLYDTNGTYELLANIAHNGDVRGLYLELTDVSDRGIEHVAQMPELQTLTVLGPSGFIMDRGRGLHSRNSWRF
jgi:hypothetical protein